MNHVPAGYHTSSGYVGILPNGKKMLFATDQDYYEYVEEADAA